MPRSPLPLSQPMLIASLVGAILATSACGAEDKVVMPEVVGLQLDVALSDIERAGFSNEVEVLGGGVFGVVVESNWEVCEQDPSPGEPVEAPRLTVDRSCESNEEVEPSESPTAAESPEALESESASPNETPAAYSYDGPDYEVVVRDDGIGPARLTQYWILADVDFRDPGYRDEVKELVVDVARLEGSVDVLVEVVTDEEIALAEATSTMQQFIRDKGDQYFLETIPKKERTGWVASYSGGIDMNSGEPSTDESAYEVIWMGASPNAEIEQWIPVIEP